LNSNSNSTRNNSNNNKLECIDSDVLGDAYWKGFTDGMNDFHHIKRFSILSFNDSAAETDYHNGYQKG
jgi:hypothetical protein